MREVLGSSPGRAMYFFLPCDTHNIYFHNIIGKYNPKYPKMFVFLSYLRNFLGIKKRVRISHGKRVIVVRVIEVLLYVPDLVDSCTL